jgi:hypothetical protein
VNAPQEINPALNDYVARPFDRRHRQLQGRRGFTLSTYAPKPQLRMLAEAVGKVGYRGLRLSAGVDA